MTDTTYEIVLRAHGGPEELRPETSALAAPGPGEIRLRQTALGVNFHDVYVRSGQYRTLALPGVPGVEGVGVVEAVGPGVTTCAVGDRVAYITARYGAYASHRLLAADLAVGLPTALDDVAAAGSFLKGLTAAMLLRRVHAVQAGETVLVHAAAGGVGQLLCRWASRLGATVIGTTGSAAKAEIAKASGCSHVILYREEDFVARVRELTDGAGVDVAYDAVGRDTFEGSLESLALCGHLVNFGQASGPVEPLAMTRLAARSSTVTRPMVFHYAADRRALESLSAALFEAVAAGWLGAQSPRVFPLAEAAQAHAFMESRAGTGAIVLVP